MEHNRTISNVLTLHFNSVFTINAITTYTRNKMPCVMPMISLAAGLSKKYFSGMVINKMHNRDIPSRILINRNALTIYTRLKIARA